MNVVILEDNLAYALDYEMILDGLDHNVIAVCKNCDSAIKVIQKSHPDFMIVDVFLEDKLTGFDVMKRIRKYGIPFIVCTGYPEAEFMEEAFELGAEAFFTKPLDKTALTYEIRNLTRILQKSEGTDKHIVVKYKRKLIKIALRDITKIETEGNYSEVYLINGSKYVIKQSLKKMRSQLDENQFFQINRSTIINLLMVKEIDTYDKKVVLSNDDKLQLGRRFKEGFIEEFKKIGAQDSDTIQ